ncbi:MAG: sulfite exporter TauE/SafE family protein, partial [Deltaproteobacteria bacterium]
FSCLANIMVVVDGLTSIAGSARFSLSALENGSARFLAIPLQRALALPSPMAALPLGLILGLMPCGMVYAPLMVAAGSGSYLTGGGIMLALGLGTMPLMLCFGSASNFISGSLRKWLLRIAGMAVALMGAAGLWRLLYNTSHHHLHHM